MSVFLPTTVPRKQIMMEEECYSPEDEKLELSDVWIRVKLSFFTHHIVKFLHNRRQPKQAPLLGYKWNIQCSADLYDWTCS